MGKQVPDTDKGRDTVRDQVQFQHVSTKKKPAPAGEEEGCINPANRDSIRDVDILEI